MNKTYKTEVINKLAEKAKVNEQAFSELYMTLEPSFKSVIESYLIKNNLTGFSFDMSDYISVAGQALWESIKDYDSNKGDFIQRFVYFARNRMKEITDYNLAAKRFDKSKQVVSFEVLFESNEFDLEDKTSGFDDTYEIVSEFVNSDKDGKVIEILMSTSDTKLRHLAFTKLFGQYEATERKRVQRVRERLQAHLTKNGVLV